ncbi:hypothetical protein [Kitasatospora sp. NPDC059088]|uniref:hypothetical protein n=1 Tax=unclassified Kitasatospora TaxID=2633591 RepID=UPI0036A13A11
MRMTERLWAATVLAITCAGLGGCSGAGAPAADTAASTPAGAGTGAGTGAGGGAEEVEGTELGSGHLRQIVESVYLSGTAGLRGGEVLRPGPGKPLALSPCRLEAPRAGVRIDDKVRTGAPTVPVPALYELRVPAAADGMWASVYVLARGTDSTKLLADVVTAGRACEPRTVAPDDPRSRSTVPVATTVGITTGTEGPGVAVLTRSVSAAPGATTPPAGPGWTIGPDGKLVPDGDLRASPASGPVDVDYGEAVFYGTNGRVLVEMVRVGGNRTPTNASPGAPAAEEAYPAAQRALRELLAGFKGLPD